MKILKLFLTFILFNNDKKMKIIPKLKTKVLTPILTTKKCNLQLI